MQKLSSEFQRIADFSSEDEEAQLSSPGIEGLYMFLAGVFDDNTILLEDVRSGYEA